MDDYKLSDELIAAVIEDRGIPHPWSNIPADRTALVVIDMQKLYDAEFPGGSCDRARHCAFD